jgi:hypothetical protein
LKTNFAKIVEMPSTWWKQTGEEIASFIYENVTVKGLDYKDRPFKALDPRYATRKASGKIRRSHASAKANLFLTGDMMGNLKYIRHDKQSVTIGWSAGESEKLVGNANMGRIVTTQSTAISPKTQRRLDRFIYQQTEKNIKKNDTRNIIKLGR